MRARLAVLALASLAAACGPREVPYRMALITDTCGGGSPLAGVTELLFRVYGPGIQPPLEKAVRADSGGVQLPPIPAGPGRVVEVRGYAGEPRAAGRLVSLGRTAPFEVPAVVPPQGHEPGELTVFLRPVDALTAPSVSVAPTVCTHPSAARAGHTATLLPDGRVLIAGGYRLDAGVKVALSGAETFDPRTGIFADAPELGVTDALETFTPSPRAFHTATALDDGRVLIAGGEVYGEGGAPSPLDTALVFDPARATHAYGSAFLTGPRSRHGAASDGQGHVFLVGGAGASLAPVQHPELFDVAKAQAAASGELVPRLGAAAAAISGGVVAVAGGSDGVGLSRMVQLFAYDGVNFSSSSRTPVALTQGRRGAAIASFGAGKLLVIGGYGTLDDVNLDPLATTEAIQPSTEPATLADGPNITARGELCAVGLPDGRVVTIGGRSLDESMAPASDPSVEVITPTPAGAGATLGMEPLAVARSQHTCTLLKDGTVLVVGGVRESGGISTVLQDALLYTPAPRD